MHTETGMRLAMQQRILHGIEWLNSRDDAFWDGYADCAEFDRESLLDGNWVTGLNLKTLDLYNGTYCVLGQVGKSYMHITDYANMCNMDASELGFYLDAEEYSIGRLFGSADWALLTELWIEAIEKLRREQAVLL